MGRRRFVNDVDSESDAQERFSDDPSSDSDGLDTQEEAFNKYSDFASTRKKPKAKSKKSSSLKEERTDDNDSIEETFIKTTQAKPWDTMLSEFEKRNINNQQAKMLVVLCGALFVYFVLGNVFLSSNRYSAVGDMLSCTSVSNTVNEEIIKCESKRGFNLRVIEEQSHYILLEIAAGISSSGFGNLIYSLFSVVKYGVFLILGLTVGAFAVTKQGGAKMKILSKKYSELSSEIKRKLQVMFARGKSGYTVGRAKSHTDYEDTSSEDESIPQEEYSSSEEE